MLRTVQFVLALLAGFIAVLVALLVPVHLRAVDPRVLERAGASGRSLTDAAGEMASREPAVAKLLLRAAEDLRLPNTGEVMDALRSEAENRVALSPDLVRQFEKEMAGGVQVRETPMLTALRPRENRERLLNTLHTADALRVLRTRGLTNFSLFAPVGSAAGFPLDATILTSAFVMEQSAYGGKAETEGALREEVLRLTSDAMFTPAKSKSAKASRRSSQLEEFYLDMFALAKRLSSEQLMALTSYLPNFASLDRLARRFQENPTQLPVLYSSVILSHDGGAVAEYLAEYPDSSFEDLGLALRDGVRAVSELVHSQKPIYRASFHNAILSDPHLAFITRPLLGLAANSPPLAFLVKFALFFAGGLLLAWSIRLAKRGPVASDPWVPQFALARRATFAAVFVMAAVLFSEPYLVHETKGEDTQETPELHFSLFGNLTPPPIQNAQPSSPMINTSTLVAMGVFFVLQGSIYLFCLTKLAEIRRQHLTSLMKLRLMENEENLFDAGLYCGLFGTAASLILLTIGLIKPSLISAYSSTLFGILFVALLKIFHVRPYKRRLILESAAEAA